jgi:hypothetical protein
VNGVGVAVNVAAQGTEKKNELIQNIRPHVKSATKEKDTREE